MAVGSDLSAATSVVEALKEPTALADALSANGLDVDVVFASEPALAAEYKVSFADGASSDPAAMADSTDLSASLEQNGFSVRSVESDDTPSGAPSNPVGDDASSAAAAGLALALALAAAPRP